MTAIAVQGAVGEIGRKAATELTFSFNSVAEISGRHVGANKHGLFLLNSGDDDAGKYFERTFTLATTDFGIRNFKHIRFISIGLETDVPFTVIVTADRKIDPDHTGTFVYDVLGPGLQYVQIPVSSFIQGRYFTIKISSGGMFRIDSIEASIYIRPAGIR